MTILGGFSSMDRLVRTAAYYGAVKRMRWDDDFVDRCNHLYTGIVLVIFSIIVSTKQYVGEPIVCWTPSHWSKNHQVYAEHVCWVSNTYWLPMDDRIPTDIPDREDRQISYYQWVPFLLLSQALLFHVPCLIWRALNHKSGINLKNIVEVANDVRNLNPESRYKTLQYLVRHIEICLATQREYRSGKFVRFQHALARLCLLCGKRYGNMLVVMYFTCKVLYVFNVVGQMYFLSNFLQTNYTFYGIEILRDLHEKQLWTASGRFPRITMCDLVIRQLGNRHRHTVQCVLPINMFNEKIYIFIWFWFSAVAIMTVINIISWGNCLLFPEKRLNFVKKYLKITSVYKKEEKRFIARFVFDYLRIDGILTLELLGRNAGQLILTEIIKILWINFNRKFVANPAILNIPPGSAPLGLPGYHKKKIIVEDDETEAVD